MLYNEPAWYEEVLGRIQGHQQIPELRPTRRKPLWPTIPSPRIQDQRAGNKAADKPLPSSFTSTSSKNPYTPTPRVYSGDTICQEGDGVKVSSAWAMLLRVRHLSGTAQVPHLLKRQGSHAKRRCSCADQLLECKQEEGKLLEPEQSLARVSPHEVRASTLCGAASGFDGSHSNVVAINVGSVPLAWADSNLCCAVAATVSC